jgi:hypothetical protein
LVNQLKTISADSLRKFHTHRKIAEFCFLGQSRVFQHKTCHRAVAHNHLISFVFILPTLVVRAILARTRAFRTVVVQIACAAE